MAAPLRDETPLDNAVWNALTGPLARFALPGQAERSGPPRALRFDPEVAIFAAVPGPADSAAWDILAGELPVGAVAAFARREVAAPPAGWMQLFRGPCFQMVADPLPERRAFDFVELAGGDAAEMLALVQRTEPGPFFARTHELGRYIGVRRGGRLVAMAGERLRAPGFVELSAVCTLPEVRGEGLGAALTLEIARAIRDRGDEAFLHVLRNNEPALALYRKLGFRIRSEIDVVVAQWLGAGSSDS